MARGTPVSSVRPAARRPSAATVNATALSQITASHATSVPATAAIATLSPSTRALRHSIALPPTFVAGPASTTEPLAFSAPTITASTNRWLLPPAPLLTSIARGAARRTLRASTVATTAACATFAAAASVATCLSMLIVEQHRRRDDRVRLGTSRALMGK